MSAILAKDTRQRWERRLAHAAGETFDETLEERPKSQAALDKLWGAGSGYLTRVQYEAGDWLRRLYNGESRSHVRIMVDFGNTPDAAAGGKIDREDLINAALSAVGQTLPHPHTILILEWTCCYEYSLADIARKMAPPDHPKGYIHHETAKRRISATLEHLADHRFGWCKDRAAWREAEDSLAA